MKEDLVKETKVIKPKKAQKCPTITEKDVKIKDKRTPENKKQGIVLSPKDKVKESASAGKAEEIKKPKKNTVKKSKKVILVAPPEIIDFASLIQGPSKVKKLEEEVAPEINKEDTKLEPQIDITP
jgi:hypothetical protein